MSETATPTETPAASEAEQNLTPQEQEALKVAREGLPEVDPHAQPDNTPQRPEGIPEKFWDAEKGEVRTADLAQSYAALEAKLSGKAPEADPAENEGGEEDGDVEVKNGKITKKAEEAGEGDNPVTALIQTAATEFGADGQFTEETAKSLAEAGIPAEVQQVYLAGLNALQQQQTAAVHGYVGGEENYNSMAQWAGANLSDDELDAFNASLDNPALAQNAVVGLYARFQQARPSEGQKVTPQNGTTDAGDIFASREEVTAAMSDKRYSTDPVYRREVEAKMARTLKAGKSHNG